VLAPQTCVIDGLPTTVQPLPFMRASSLAARLLKLFGPAFGQLMSMAGDEDIGPAVATLCSQVDPVTLPDLLREILSSTSVSLDGRAHPLGSAGAIDLVFMGRLATGFRVVAYALEVNFAGFFVELRSWLGNALAAATASQSISRATSQGSPGADSDSSTTGG
jgi:hypothetical protein